MSRLLIISYLFPPVGGVGVQRALSLAKYLPEHGFDVHVLYASNAAGPVADPALLKQVPESVKLHGTFTPELPFEMRQRLWRLCGGKPGQTAAPVQGRERKFSWRRLPVEAGRRILCPEPEILWVPFALRRARKLVRMYGIDRVLVTAPPFSAFLVGNALKREFAHLKLITDFRDDWLRFYLGEFDYQKADYTRRRAIEIERNTVELSDCVVVVTEMMLQELRQRYPDLPPQKFAFVPNGFDPAVLPEVESQPESKRGIVVGHIGTVYSASSPRFYLDVLDAMPETVRDVFETRFIGRVTESEKPFLANRKSKVSVRGFLPQQEALAEMAQADFLLLTMTDRASLTGKIFEYLAMGKPILAIAHEDGEVARILRNTGAGWCAAPDNPEGILKLLSKAHQARAGSSSFQPNWNAIRRFERPRLAAEFGALIQSA